MEVLAEPRGLPRSESAMADVSGQWPGPFLPYRAARPYDLVAGAGQASRPSDTRSRMPRYDVRRQLPSGRCPAREVSLVQAVDGRPRPARTEVQILRAP